ncbi:hypothetical protein CINF_1343 [Candidatus Campylobacter infans]|uniref:Uncharacterized protein n=1 Tax=Candidatus Campylobacter infans TaxID=2561898 RepID=A0A7H9CKV2_9BACT|nr:hypothetical protein CINF_1343 [Candidatus Campylobacter infans]
MNQNYKTSKIPSQIIKFILKTTYTNFKLHQNLPIKFLCGRLNERERERESKSAHYIYLYYYNLQFCVFANKCAAKPFTQLFALQQGNILCHVK